MAANISDCFSVVAEGVTDLVLAIAIASSGSSGHFNGGWGNLHFLRTMMKEWKLKVSDLKDE